MRQDVCMAEVELATALEVLRAELTDAWSASEGSAIRFRVTEVTLTVQAAARTDTKLGGKIRWWLVEGGADRSSAQEATQTLVLTLTPQLYDDAGHTGPLDVADRQAAPGE